MSIVRPGAQEETKSREEVEELYLAFFVAQTLFALPKKAKRGTWEKTYMEPVL